MINTQHGMMTIDITNIASMIYTPLFKFINNNPTINVDMENTAPTPYTISTWFPKSLKNEDTITPVKTYFETSIR